MAAATEANQPKEDNNVPTDLTARGDSGPAQHSSEKPAADTESYFSDANIIVQIEQRLFRVHEYKLRGFEKLKALIVAAKKDKKGRKTLQLPGTIDDFCGMLTVLYSSGYEPTTFSPDTLKSTLRLATTHGHPILRAFAIQNLEKETLPAIEWFALSRDCDVGAWMSRALDDLCWREEPITLHEAQVLGSEKLVEIACWREAVQFERGLRVKHDVAESTNGSSAVSAVNPPSFPSLTNSIVSSCAPHLTVSTSDTSAAAVVEPAAPVPRLSVATANPATSSSSLAQTSGSIFDELDSLTPRLSPTAGHTAAKPVSIPSHARSFRPGGRGGARRAPGREREPAFAHSAAQVSPNSDSDL